MNLRDGCFVRYRFAVVVLLALAGVLVPVTPVASADTALPINRVLYVQRVLPPQQTNYCGLAYTTRIVAADLPGGGNQQVLYTNSQGCYPLSYASVSPDRTRVAAVLGGSFFVFDVGSALAGNPETHGFQYGYCHLPKWNRDGSRILCEGPNETLRIVDAVTLNILGSLPLADRGIGPQDSDWLPDGDLLVTGVDKMSTCPVPGGTRTLNNVWRLDMNGLAMSGEPRPLLSTSCETGKDFIYNVRSAPDGSRFAYHAVQGQFGASIWVAEIDGGNDRQLAAATATRAFGRSSWSWSGRKIITDRLERDNTSPFGLYGHIDTIDVTTGTRRTDIPATGAYDALTPSSAEPADTTAPVVHGTADRPPDRNGWYNHPAVITWSPADEDDPSEALTVPPPTVAASQGKDVVYASGPSCDPAGNCATGTVTLSLDSTPPVTTVATTSAWVSTNVVLQFAVQDNLSGVDTTSHTVDGGPIATSSTAEISAEGVHTVSFWSTDRAGNVESVRTVTVKIDKGAPAITYTLAPPANASGWHNSPVTATFSCSDSLSGVAFCSWPVSVIQDGANQSVTATAADNAGNQASITINNINIDTTKPTVQPIAFSVNPKPGSTDELTGGSVS